MNYERYFIIIFIKNTYNTIFMLYFIGNKNCILKWAESGKYSVHDTSISPPTSLVKLGKSKDY